MPVPPWDPGRCYRGTGDFTTAVSVDQPVRRESQEFLVAIIGGERVEKLRPLHVLPRRPSLLAEMRAHLRQLLGEELAEELHRHLAPVLQHAFRRADPL